MIPADAILLTEPATFKMYMVRHVRDDRRLAFVWQLPDAACLSLCGVSSRELIRVLRRQRPRTTARAVR